MACTALTGCGGTTNVTNDTDVVVNQNTEINVDDNAGGTAGVIGDNSDAPVSGQEETTPAIPTAKELTGTYQWTSMEFNGKVYTLEEMVQEQTKENNVFGLDQISEGNENAALAQAKADGIFLYEDGTAEIRLQYLTDGSSICTWEYEDDNLVFRAMGGDSAIYAPLDGNVITLNLSDMVLTYTK